LAEAHASLNERSIQQQLLQRALLIQETVFGPDHEEVRLTLEELADAYGWYVRFQDLAIFSFVAILNIFITLFSAWAMQRSSRNASNEQMLSRLNNELPIIRESTTWLSIKQYFVLLPSNGNYSFVHHVS
jgi:hypothetical protein